MSLKVWIHDYQSPCLSHHRRIDDLQGWLFKNWHRANHSLFISEITKEVIDVDRTSAKNLLESVRMAYGLQEVGCN